jgi:hypothetical protein
MFEDNQGCIRMTKSDKLSSRTKLIDIKDHMLHVLHEQGIIGVKYCPTDTMIADMMTKPLPKDRLRNLVDMAWVKSE